MIECDYLMRLHFTEMGLGVAVTGDAEVCHVLFPGHVFVPIREPLAQRQIWIFLLKGRRFSHAMEDFQVF